MKQIKFGDILSVKQGIIVHGCNAQGVMGSGIAAEIRAVYPGAYLEYIKYFQSAPRDCLDKAALGEVITYDVPDTQLTIANAITQLTYGKDGRRYVSYAAIQASFDRVIQLATQGGALRSVHYPMIGAGLGGGDWAIISDIIDTCFSKAPPALQQTLWIYEP